MSKVALGLVLVLAVAACGDDAADPERFCEIDAEVEELGDPFEASPDEAREMLATGRALFDEAAEVAPEEIRAAVETQNEFFEPFFELFEAADFDPTQIDEAEIEALFEEMDEEAEASFEIVEEWVAENCDA